MTCDRCPKRDECVELCEDMNKVLDCGDAISHKSPHPCGMYEWLPEVTATVGLTPLEELLTDENNAKVETRMMGYIRMFSAKQGKADVHKRELIEEMLKLMFLEGYAQARAAEILGDTYAEFNGKELIERNNGYAPIQKQRGSRTCTRYYSQFSDFVRMARLTEKIKEVLSTGSMECINIM